jgi:hypothetical protein
MPFVDKSWKLTPNRNTALAFELSAINPSVFGGIIFKAATPEHTGDNIKFFQAIRLEFK